MRYNISMTEKDARSLLLSNRAQRSSLSSNGWTIAPLAEDAIEWFSVSEEDAQVLERIERELNKRDHS